MKYILLVSALIYSLFSSAQVHVRDEPRHHNVFENDVIRILDVYLGPGDTTLYHLHNTPSVFIILSNCIVRSQLLGGQPQKGVNLTGIVSFDSINTARIHRVWNEDTSWFHVMDIELTSKSQKNNIPVLQNRYLKLLFKEQQVNGYDAELKTGDILQLPNSLAGYLLVSKGESVVDYRINGTRRHRIMKAGHYIWIDAENNFSIEPKDHKPATFVLLQLK
jgi:hypothetical protein